MFSRAHQQHWVPLRFVYLKEKISILSCARTNQSRGWGLTPVKVFSQEVSV